MAANLKQSAASERGNASSTRLVLRVPKLTDSVEAGGELMAD